MRKYSLFITCMFMLSSVAFGQLTFMVKAPEDNNSAIYVSGTFETWSGGSPQYMLRPLDEYHTLSITPDIGVLEFKFTQGSWDQVETTVSGNERSNRAYNYTGGIDTLWLHIEGWKNNAAIVPSTANAQVVILNDSLCIPQLNGRRRQVRLYLPKNYKESLDRYPVLYMHDGQALFDKATASYGKEWMIDETLDSLYEHKGIEIIVVGVDNGGHKRIDEYSPWINEEYGGGEGQLLTEFIVNTLKPYIDSHYRTLKNASNTGMMGASMGGLITHYAGVKHPEVFGRIAVLSPSYWFTKRIYEFTHSESHHPESRWVMMAGDAESETMVGNMLEMVALLHDKGWEKQNFLIHVEKGGKHSESTWQKLVAPAVLWMFDEQYNERSDN